MLRVFRPVRAALVPTAACLWALGCGGPGQGGAAQEPRAIVVGPGLDRGPTIATSEAADPAGEEIAPFDLVLGRRTICLRVAGRVHCGPEVSREHALTSSPPLPGIDDAIHVALGYDFGCATTRAGTVMCFGDNKYGQLGARVRAERSDNPVAVVGVAGAKRVIAGDEHACALLGDGTVRCWGRNDGGQTGSSTSYLPNARELVTAEPVPTVKDVKLLVASGAATCATARTSPTVTCWGRTLFGDEDVLGQQPSSHPPAAIADLAAFDDLAVTAGAFCGIRKTQVFCWSESRSYPKRPAMGPATLLSVNVARARRVRVASSHACAVLVDGAVTCWGDNGYRALGRSDSSFDPLPPGVVKGLPFAVDIVVGESMSCAISAARELYCWGSWPQADGSKRVEASPVKVRITD